VITGTLLAWHETITHRRSFEQQRDEPRMVEAFLNLAGRCRRWPSPAEFLEAIPRIDTPVHREPRLENANARSAGSAGAKAIGEIAIKLGLNP
jgi:hypothetical protein